MTGPVAIALPRCTDGAIALSNLSTAIAARESISASPSPLWEELVALLRLRGAILGSIVDHERAALIVAHAADSADAWRGAIARAGVAAHWHLFDTAMGLLDEADRAGAPPHLTRPHRAAILQGQGRYDEALALREADATEYGGFPELTGLAALLAEIGQFDTAEIIFSQAVGVYADVSPLPLAQLLFEWGLGAMRLGRLDRAEEVLSGLLTLCPGHVPARGHRAEILIARGEDERALAELEPLAEWSDDPEYLGLVAELRLKLGVPGGASAAARAAAMYEQLIARHPEAYADHAAGFYLGAGADPARALQLAEINLRCRDTPRARRLKDRAMAAGGVAAVAACG